jgi:hypothetical protein
MEGTGSRREGDKLYCFLPLPFFLPSFCGPHTGLFHQGQRPKTVEATITHDVALLEVSYRSLYDRLV